MMTQKDEITSDRHLNMTFPEFIEAVCRVAERLAIPNITKEDVPEEEWLDPHYTRKWAAKTVSAKIEAYLLLLCKRLLPEKFYEEQVKHLTSLKKLDNIYANDMDPVTGLGKVTQTVKALVELSE